MLRVGVRRIGVSDEDDLVVHLHRVARTAIRSTGLIPAITPFSIGSACFDNALMKLGALLDARPLIASALRREARICQRTR